jgi:hypothetical protein
MPVFLHWYQPQLKIWANLFIQEWDYKFSDSIQRITLRSLWKKTLTKIKQFNCKIIDEWDCKTSAIYTRKKKFPK